MMSTCSQSAPFFMVTMHSWPRAPKSADRMEGAMMARGLILAKFEATNMWQLDGVMKKLLKCCEEIK